MKRRALLTGAVALGAAVALSPYVEAETLKRGVRVAAGQDRFGQPAPLGNSRALDCKVSTKDTNGGWCSFASQWQGAGGPPLHMHHNQEEWFYVVDGSFVFQVGEEKFRIGPGDSVLAPRKIPHAFTHIREERGSIVSVFQPAGGIEAFFHEYGKLGDASTEQAKRLYMAYDMELLGPPLNVPEMLKFFQS